ncbi:unnamed protein product [Polarella glacialis]|uniref:Cytochrome c oxidase assembly factor 5 n=1 Tax=Polarella glacialis TaxID=89957 RepID=A0A813DT08_POLGL|nr:unnamed protein product [Polarella glacialis]CAE8611788.1 unnamed protein product [Polarella glacialis]|mmetsp:Transcript_73502/g.132407  ORF Transcript_73502/g.132407 Transcript_73502/m.132407 type:complete len:159 (+) Transcript_73502:46-522(+)|eukprot:CAMPEP_0115064676 /NCGR_PEP_ID=MMETSP0227-20121206/9824_1 /TAXON_ID=89957 /ORGANISM="Polarella glacialis, Strain CCMP 1383" /LENGTH=158 /DNA_ID=CAMNT_0002450373 /DNA_START=45 /DNA_END=521 /DNA_ORIENTATION=-
MGQSGSNVSAGGAAMGQSGPNVSAENTMVSFSQTSEASSSGALSAAPERSCKEGDQERSKRLPPKKEEVWLPPGSFKMDPSKPHRKPANSCTRIREDMLQCYEGTRCYKEGAPFEECLNSNDQEYVSTDCIWLRKGYAQCRRDLLNRNRIWQRGNRAA